MQRDKAVLEALERLAARLDALTEEVRALRELLSGELNPSAGVPLLPEGEGAAVSRSDMQLLLAPAGEESPMTIDDFVPKGGDATFPDAKVSRAEGTAEGEDELFEPLLDFDLTGNISLADTFLYANEFFGGSRAAVEELLTEIERFSSISQVEHYLYEVCGYSKEDDAVVRLMSFIISNARVRRR